MSNFRISWKLLAPFFSSLLLIACGGTGQQAELDVYLGSPQASSALINNKSLIETWRTLEKEGGVVKATNEKIQQNQLTNYENRSVKKIINPMSSTATTRYFIGFGSRPAGQSNSYTGHAVVFFIRCFSNICSEEITGFNLESGGINFTQELTDGIRNINNILYKEVDESTYSRASAVRDSHTFRSGFFIVITDCVR